MAILKIDADTKKIVAEANISADAGPQAARFSRSADRARGTVKERARSVSRSNSADRVRPPAASNEVWKGRIEPLPLG